MSQAPPPPLVPPPTSHAPPVETLAGPGTLPQALALALALGWVPQPVAGAPRLLLLPPVPVAALPPAAARRAPAAGAAAAAAAAGHRPWQGPVLRPTNPKPRRPPLPARPALALTAWGAVRAGHPPLPLPRRRPCRLPAARRVEAALAPRPTSRAPPPAPPLLGACVAGMQAALEEPVRGWVLLLRLPDALLLPSPPASAVPNAPAHRPAPRPAAEGAAASLAADQPWQRQRGRLALSTAHRLPLPRPRLPAVAAWGAEHAVRPGQLPAQRAPPAALWNNNTEFPVACHTSQAKPSQAAAPLQEAGAAGAAGR